jgi:hypothetical protein
MLVDMYSKHALERVSQRNIDKDDVRFVLNFGQKIHNGGALFIFLGNKNIPEEYMSDDKFAKLEGTTLVVSKDGNNLITAYKNKKGLRQIKKKIKKFIPYKKVA